jgi:hypothetical protein
MSLEKHKPRKVFAVWNTDAEERRFCASAGVGTLLAKYVVEARQGIAFGSRYEDDGFVRVAEAKDIEGIKRFSGSKYVQSIFDRTQYDTIISYLSAGRIVIFVGTPCQIATLNAYVAKHHIDDGSRLITVDIICHGTCPPSYLHDEIMYLKQKYNLPDITDVRFRSNDDNDYCLTFWNDGKLIFRRPYYLSYYLKGFLDGITLRECCYSCPFANPERVGDITIGDYIGLDEALVAEHTNDGNISAVFVNTKKGESFFEELIKVYPQLVVIERDYSERLALAPPLRMPFPRNLRQPDFMKRMQKMGYVKAIRKILWKNIFILEHPWYSLPLRFIFKIKRLLIKRK